MIDNLCIKIGEIACSKNNISRKYIQNINDSYRIDTLYVNYKNKYISESNKW